MIKVHYQEDQEDLYRLCDGMMNTLIETESGVKSAASDLISRDIIEQFRPDKDHFLIHCVAMGDTETYGPNKNADGWPKEALERRHHTFVKNGHFFREHRNRDPKKKIGDIKYAAFDPKGMHRVELLMWGNKEKAASEYAKAREGKELSFSMSARVPDDVCSCLPPGTLIHTKEGVKEIESILEGDQVLTHNGRWRPVTRLFNRKGESSTRIIHVQGTPDPLELTEDHEVYVISGGNATDNQRKFQRPILEGDAVIGINGFDAEPDFIPAKDLIPGDIVLFPLYGGLEVKPKVDPWLFGLYLADGCIFGRKRGRKRNGDWRETGIQFSVGTSQPEIIELIQSKCEELGLPCCVRPDKRANAVGVVIHSVDMAKEFSRLGGVTKGKKVSSEVLEWDVESRMKVIAGWIDGDGNFGSYLSGCVRGVTVLPNLAHTLRLLIASTGVVCSVYKSRISSPWAVSEFAYFLTLQGHNLNELASHFVRVVTPKLANQKRSFIFQRKDGQKFLAHRISDIEESSVHEVFNFEVDEDHSYIAAGITTHNCCGNRAKSAALYCDDLKNHALQYLPKFKKYAYAINEEPTFFDNSSVANPADRIARYLDYKFHDADMRKAASSQKQVIMGTEWAEYEGVMLPGKYVPSGPTGQLIEKLAAEEVYQASIQPSDALNNKKAAFCSCYADTALREDATDAEMEAFRAVRPGTLFRELAKKACILPFPTFAAYATGKTIAEVKSDPDFMKAAHVYLPAVFTKLAEFAPMSFDNMFNSSDAFSSSCDDRQHDLVQNFMDSVGEKFGIDTERVQNRVTEHVLKKASGTYIEASKEDFSVVFDKSASADAGASEVLADAYANYQLTALRDIESFRGEGSVDEPELSLIVSNNRRLIFR